MHTTTSETLLLHPGELRYQENLLSDKDCLALLDTLQHELPWEQPTIRIMGKQMRIPRLQVWMGDPGLDYVYSRKTFTPVPWHPAILQIKAIIEASTCENFNSVLCNFYRTGQDSVSWHADDEPELGPKPVIASFSLGAPRTFQFRKKGETRMTHQLELGHNSLLVMSEEVQPHWQHQLPKTTRVIGPRINLTFRYRIPH